MHAHRVVQRRRKDFLSLPKHQQELIGPAFLERLRLTDECIRANGDFLADIVSEVGVFADGDHPDPEKDDADVTEFDIDKLRSTLKQFVRDWAIEGQAERNATYDPILHVLETRFANVPLSERGGIKALVPGAGLGRLAYDICTRGFSCQGNEFSYFMVGKSKVEGDGVHSTNIACKLLASQFVLNQMSSANQYSIYPYIHSFSNVRKPSDQLTPVTIPDVLPGNLPSTADFSMVAGDFIEVYGKENPKQLGQWDAIVTCFFIDTANNIVEYLEIIYGALKPGGLWINLGPLLYHFENLPGECSIELSLDEVKHLAQRVGFKLEVQDDIVTTYTSSPDSMLKYTYDCAFWTATK